MYYKQLFCCFGMNNTLIPVCKNKGEITSPGNYRPISLLSVFDKLLEKVMYFRLYNHLQTNNIASDLLELRHISH